MFIDQLCSIIRATSPRQSEQTPTSSKSPALTTPEKLVIRDSVTTFAAPDIGEQFFSGVGWNGCPQPQPGCGFSKFRDGFGGHGKL